MEIEFIDVLLSVLSLVLLAIPGFIFAKLKMLPEKATEAFSVVVLYGAQSALVFKSFQGTAFEAETAINMLIVAGLAVVVHLVMIGICCAVTAGKGEDAKIRCVRYAGVFSNCGFMGFPFLKAVFAGHGSINEIMIYGAVVVAVFNIINWTFGVYLITGDKTKVSLKKIAANPVIISVILGFLLYALLPRPIADMAAQNTVIDKILEKLMEVIGYLSEIVTPVSMIVIGIRLAGVNLKSLFLDKYAYLASGLKLIVMSLLTMLCVLFLPVEEEIKYTLFFLLSMPCATSGALFAVQFGGDGDFASVTVLLSTVLSVGTIPLMFLLFKALLGIV